MEGGVQIVPVEPDSSEAMDAMLRYFTELDERFVGGFDVEDAVASSTVTLRPPLGLFLLAIRDGEVLGCGGVQWIDDQRGEIKRMWISPAARGAGLGRTLLVALEAQITDGGRTVAILDTNGVLTQAIAMYRRAGYVDIERYNDNPFAQLWFEKRLA